MAEDEREERRAERIEPSDSRAPRQLASKRKA
jgi:hypothetical protein